MVFFFSSGSVSILFVVAAPFFMRRAQQRRPLAESPENSSSSGSATNETSHQSLPPLIMSVSCPADALVFGAIATPSTAFFRSSFKYCRRDLCVPCVSTAKLLFLRPRPAVLLRRKARRLAPSRRGGSPPSLRAPASRRQREHRAPTHRFTRSPGLVCPGALMPAWSNQRTGRRGRLLP